MKFRIRFKRSADPAKVRSMLQVLLFTKSLVRMLWMEYVIECRKRSVIEILSN